MHRRFVASFAALMVVGAMCGATASAQPAKPAAPAPAAPAEAVFTGPDKLMSTLSSRIATAAETDSFDVIVQFTTAANPALYQAVEQSAGRLGYKAQWDAAIQGFAAKLTKRQIRALQGLSVIKQVDLDQPVHITNDTSTLYTGVQKARADYGIDGSRGFACCSANNVVAAVIDTGIDAAHVVLQGKVIGWVDYVNGMTTPYDDQGHGSHVSGIIAGRGAGNAAYKGNAPGAALVGIKVLNSAGSGSTTNIINGINWMISHKATYNIKVANMSLGGSGCSN
ncbi:MAG: peptidase and in kexin sedolisin, partial [Firmicutes bacterium]|nr:peptidase and in kexin sedolisin [Bacillota bacterium]